MNRLLKKVIATILLMILLGANGMLNIAYALNELETSPVAETEKVETLPEFDVIAQEKMGKGQIYSNYTNELKKEMGYTLGYVATVKDLEKTENVEFVQSIDKFLTAAGEEGYTTVSGNNYTYNKSIRISEELFKTMLGEEGSITLYQADKTEIGTINKETSIEDGKYVLDIGEKDCNSLSIVTSKPIAEGRMVIELEKAIKTEIAYSKAQMKAFEKMEVGMQVKANGETKDVAKQISLIEPKTTALLTTSRTDLTTVVKNENVEIRATLDTSSQSYALYKNPTLKITLPTYITKVDIVNHDILMANGLKIKGEPKVTTENENKVITVILEGASEGYTIGAEYQGTIVVLYADITTETLTPTHTDKMKMEVTNEDENAADKKAAVETELNFVAPLGIIAANGISNYADKKADILSISEKGQTGEIAAYSAKRVAKVYGKIVNNYDNAINNIVILGRMPVKENTGMNGEKSLNGTFSTTLKTGLSIKGIEASKYKVYYSDNVNASADLSSSSNKWTETPTTASKSYMIVTNEYEMKTGEMIEFSYDVEIPANLKHNNQVYEMYTVYYNNASKIGRMAEVKTSSVMELTTGEGPELTAELSSTVDVVRNGQVVKMKVLVKNTGSMTAENVKVNVPLPENATFMTYSTGTGFYEEEAKTQVINLETIEKDKTKEAIYYIKMDDYVESTEYEDHGHGEEVTVKPALPKEIAHNVTITADDLSGEIPSNTYKMTLQEGKIAIAMNSLTNEKQVGKKGEVLNFRLNITNISRTEILNNTIVTIALPEGMKYKDAEIANALGEDEETQTIQYDEKTNTVQINLGTVETKKAVQMNVELEEFEGSMPIIAKVKADGTEEHYSNAMEFTSEIIDLEVGELTATPKYVKEGKELTYQIRLTNKGDSPIYNVGISNKLPVDLDFVEANYTCEGKTTKVTTLKSEDKVEVLVPMLNVGQSATIEVVCQAVKLPNKDDKEIRNQMEVIATGYEGSKTNVVTNFIEYNEEIHKPIEGEEPSLPEEPRYKITGTAWLDSNKNGRRDTDEQTLSNVSAVLLDKETNKIVRDVDTNAPKRTTTGDNGAYEFTNLPEGEYIVIFLYDAARYSLTTYREKDVEEGLNSDVININITVDGVRTIAGTTDAIRVSNENVRDIDIGLYTAEKFDLRLDKYISKVTRTTEKSGTKTYEYTNSKAAKVEVLGSSLGKSSIVIEYKIAITNEGAVPGYAKKIVDYLPEGVGFNTELNKDWYLSENGNVYNASLANTVIHPGETKEVTLVVTKKLTESSLGVLSNEAEIYESYNEQGLKDMDSVAGNKEQGEDDMSKADVVVSIVTGKIILYTTLSLAVVAVLATAIYMIKKKVLDTRK